MILVDASVWIDFLADKPTPQAARLSSLFGKGKIALADLTLTEVLQGVRDQEKFERTLFRLGALPMVEVAGRSLAIQAAHNYRRLRARGITPRGPIDTLIATWCIDSGHSLLFSDRDFQPFVDHLGLVSAMAD